MTDTNRAPSPSALNTILYGPPGTGKTYATFRKAVEICDGLDAVAAMDGPTLKARYTELRDAGRIGFVTFHQSYSYEEFVEGLRPEGGSDDAGFTLKPRNGALREITELASAQKQCHSTDRASMSKSSMTRIENRSVFKVQIGRPNKPEEEPLFREAIEDNHIMFGFADIDFSDSRFENISEIQKAYEHKKGESYKTSDQLIEATDAFRNKIQLGDIIVVPKGNSLFRAIGIVTGNYEYQTRYKYDWYAQKRTVQWLWTDQQGIPLSRIYNGQVQSWAAYRLSPDKLKVPEMEHLMNHGEVPEPAREQPFVLVMDEINRANISKVFGELITLLEEDKRAGAENEVAVRLPYSGDLFTLPANLHFLGTMNTADRSIALLDTALRRRFHFEETPPKPTLLGTVEGIDLSLLLARLNQRIEYLVDRDHLIGHAFFMGCQSRSDIDTVMRRKVLPLLAEYFHEDWERIVAVLGGEAQGFIAKDRLDVPPGLDLAMDEPRFRYTVNETFLPDAYEGLQA